MAISVNMLGLRLTIETQKRWKNGQPPHKTTGVLRRNWIHSRTWNEATRPSGLPGIISPMASNRTGTLNARLTQKRRVMSRSSGFSSSTAAVRGSSAIPQIGHAPGSVRTISGCIGQVYSTADTGAGCTGSNAIPHFGQAPGASACTSGCIGHVQRPSAGGPDGGTGFGPPSVTSSGFFSHASGSLRNFSRQCVQQK